MPKPRVPSAEVSAALKSEQEKINKAKANEELKNMLIKEVNDFQMELYNFKKLSQEKREKVMFKIYIMIYRVGSTYVFYRSLCLISIFISTF